MNDVIQVGSGAGLTDEQRKAIEEAQRWAWADRHANLASDDDIQRILRNKDLSVYLECDSIRLHNGDRGICMEAIRKDLPGFASMMRLIVERHYDPDKGGHFWRNKVELTVRQKSRYKPTVFRKFYIKTINWWVLENDQVSIEIETP